MYNVLSLLSFLDVRKDLKKLNTFDQDFLFLQVNMPLCNLLVPLCNAVVRVPGLFSHDAKSYNIDCNSMATTEEALLHTS